MTYNWHNMFQDLYFTHYSLYLLKSKSWHTTSITCSKIYILLTIVYTYWRANTLPTIAYTYCYANILPTIVYTYWCANTWHKTGITCSKIYILPTTAYTYWYANILPTIAYTYWCANIKLKVSPMSSETNVCHLSMTSLLINDVLEDILEQLLPRWDKLLMQTGQPLSKHF